MNTKRRIRGVLTGIIGDEANTIRDETVLSDVLDSLDMVELVIGVEDEFDIEISDDEAESFDTFMDLVLLVATKEKS